VRIFSRCCFPLVYFFENSKALTLSYISVVTRELQKKKMQKSHLSLSSINMAVHEISLILISSRTYEGLVLGGKHLARPLIFEYIFRTT
jgi:hypothetical protein